MGDFDDDFGDSFEDDGFMDEDSFNDHFEDEIMDDSDDLDDENSDEVTPNEHYGPDWKDWMIIGPMSEEIAEEKRRRDKIRRDMFGDD